MGEYQKQTSEVPAQSAQGLEILKHAFSEGGKVLEFRKDGGEMTVADITEHHEKLQQEHDAKRNSETDGPT